MEAEKQFDLTLTIVSWNTRELLRQCLASLAGAGVKTSYEVHVVDNASHDGSAAMVRKDFPEVRVISNSENVGFAKANNQSWSAARGRYWMLLNSDTVARPGALDALVNFMDSHAQAGLATARLVNPDGTPQFCAQTIPDISRTLLEAARLHKLLSEKRRGEILLGSYWSYDCPLQIGWTWGTALIARRAAVEQVGALSEEFFMYGEDLEWCLRMRRGGWEIWFCPQAEVLHYGGQSSAQRWTEDGRARIVLDNVYQALEIDRGKTYVRLLHLATCGALGIEWLASRAQGRDAAGITGLLKYHGRALRAGREL